MNTLQYDPETKQMIKDSLYEHLYGPVKNQYRSRLATIIDRNCILIGNAYKSFIYKGTTYKANENDVLPRQSNRLREQLHPEMDLYIEELNQLNDYELPYVLGYINNMLNSSTSLQDYFKVLPESMHKPIQDLVPTCGCRAQHLSDKAINDMRIRNTKSIELMKQRMVLNLLL